MKTKEEYIEKAKNKLTGVRLQGFLEIIGFTVPILTIASQFYFPTINSFWNGIRVVGPMIVFLIVFQINKTLKQRKISEEKINNYAQYLASEDKRKAEKKKKKINTKYQDQIIDQ